MSRFIAVIHGWHVHSNGFTVAELKSRTPGDAEAEAHASAPGQARPKRGTVMTAKQPQPMPEGAIRPPAPAAPPPKFRADLYQHMQGRQFALDILSAAKSTLSEANLFRDLMANLRKACANKPPSFASGIMEVVIEAERLRA